QEPAHEPSSYASSNGARSAAVPPPPRATPLHLEQAGGGADGSGSAAVGVDRRGNGTPPPKVIPSPPSSATARPQAGVQAAVDKENRRWAQQLNSLRAEGAMHRKEQEKLSQVKAVVKVRPKQDKLFSKKGAKLDKLLLVKGKSVPSRLKSKIFRTKGRGICPEHVKHQTLRISEVRRHYKLTSDEANHLDAYSECRPVIGDGECFYRSFIFSYLEQVIDRQDTHEEHRLLRRVSTERANLQWNSEFSRSRRVSSCLLHTWFFLV
uniref:Ubiquitinyl hydrolase 1 n=2 Tax=Aegilops tauschii subsp. strangulata TaxID=200361 RepID=A0A453N1P0_AEGTS